MPFAASDADKAELAHGSRNHVLGNVISFALENDGEFCAAENLPVFVKRVFYGFFDFTTVLNMPSPVALASLDVVEPSATIDLHRRTEDMAVVFVLQQVHLLEFVPNARMDGAADGVKDFDHLFEIPDSVERVKMMLAGVYPFFECGSAPHPRE